MDTNLLILLVVVLFTVLLAGGMLLFRKEAAGEIKAGPFSFLFRGRNDEAKPATAARKKTEPHTKVHDVEVRGDADIQNKTGQPTHVTSSTFEGDLKVTSSNPAPAPEPPKPARKR